MNRKQIVTLVLVAFVVASVAYLIANESRHGRDAGSEATAEETATGGEVSGGAGNTEGSAHTVVAYYFHGNKRCRTCLTIEAYTKEAIEQGFPHPLESGDLEFRVINVEEPENEHFIDDFELTTRSVILSDQRGGVEERWKNLNLVWEYVGDKEAFIDYIQRETEEYLGELAYE
jgi:hypothetical protein